MSQRFLTSIPPHSILGGLPEIVDSPTVVSSLDKMHGEFTGDFAGPLAIAGLLTLADAPMEVKPLSSSQALIEHLPIQGMDEGIASGDGPVWPLSDPARAQKLVATS